MGKYDLDGKSFSTIETAKYHVRNMIKSVGICKSLKTQNQPLFQRLRKVLTRHSDAIRKGVTDQYGNVTCQDIEIKYNMKKDLELRITRQDGQTTQDISWVRCINPKEKSQWQKLCSAMRNAIIGQIDQFRAKQTEKQCQSNPCLYGDLQLHVDHEIPFKKLQQNFIKLNPSDAIQDFDDCPITNQKLFKMKDKQWKQKWQKYHQENAKLRYLCTTCNLKRKKSLYNFH